MPRKTPLDDLRVLAHPLRLRILSLLTGAPMSAAEAARELGESQANVSYHVRRLAEAGLLEAVEEVRIRGGRAKRYRHDPESGTGFLQREPAEEALLLASLVEELRRRSGHRVPGKPASLTDAELWVDEQTWEQARELSLRLSECLHDAAQPPRTPGTQRVSATVALFVLGDDPEHER
ncbi:ArsR/SmtB family transcription factor [Prauserella cavernicola]|uniref:Helix-turn-helix transcriptional regulator n=1 Tax=Prauserella cavernicola TaxID=2800127 RepID=A0A934QPG0_9PSEU|nr:helix-turn-helix domain-containing protein [Prauserella cavernicola]MBK1785797.1 helix-turn-helix transcriptional regulator [Prauserella cavernicola]